MARTKKAKQEPIVNRLLQAMKFISLCQDGKGSEVNTHCTLYNNAATAYNGILACGQPIDEDLYACPQTELMALALARCGEQFAITQLTADRLLVRSGDFQAYVPCCEASKLPAAYPDAPVAAISDHLKDALKIVSVLAKDGGDQLTTASILIKNGSAIATNRKVILEAWHGLDLPEIALPKAVAAPLIKCGRKLSQFGYSPKSVTFWFEDGSWIRTQVFKERWPEDIPAILNKPIQARALSPEFFAAVKKIAPFSEDGRVYCGDNTVGSHYPTERTDGGTLTVPFENGLNRRAYDIKLLQTIAPYCEMVDELSNRDITMFHNATVRGAIGHTVVDPDPKPVTDDDIPF